MKQTRVGVGVFVWRDGKFLIGKRRGSHGHDTWSLPGGHLEYGESFSETAKREVMEETGMQVGAATLVAATNDLFPDENKHYVTIWVDTKWQANEPKITEPDKWVEHYWITFKELPSPLFEPCWSNLRAQRPDLFS